MDDMNLNVLLPLAGEVPGYGGLARSLVECGEREAVAAGAARPFLLAALHRELDAPLVVITPRPEGARQLHDQLTAWGASPLLFPEPDSLPYEGLASDPATVQQRMSALYSLAYGDKPLVVASSHAVARKTLDPDAFRDAVHTVRQGDRLDIEATLARWVELGYEWAHMVELPGSFSRRGGIIDVFPPSSELPARIELFGDEVASIRRFDPETQRSVGLVDSVTVVPAGEEPAVASLLDYLPQGSLLVLEQPAELRHELQELDAESRGMRRERTARGELGVDASVPYHTWDELSERVQNVEKRLSLWTWREGAPVLPFAPAIEYGGRLEPFIADVKKIAKQRKKRIVIVSHQARRLSELLEEKDIIAPALGRLERVALPGAVSLVQGSLGRGWDTGSTMLFTDYEIFGFTKKRRRLQRYPVRRAGSLSDLVVGDNVVHVEHGIAKFAGTAMKTVGQSQREYLVLEYAHGDKLYVPGDQVDRVGRYVGSSGAPPALSRLGTQEWARAKRRVKQAADELARELRALYAEREVIPGFAFAADTTWQQDLEASFPYIETPDQARAVVEIKGDMERSRPMDRLVCGDVGYGKTEVALRAAFKAVLDGAQVAILVPTTVLAQQHFQTFTERLAAFPVNVAVLSRFRSPREQGEAVAGLKRGTVDIVIGTHRLLQKDVGFKNLGLVIIDEEQRFGVAHKEHLKKLRRQVDVLTLTATPIPRTLYMSLSGVRDMSTMETPPEERLPIKTTVSEYDESLVRNAVLRELERGGQVFLVHNRVQSIHRIASRVSELVPEAGVAIAHGQMPEEGLERVMLEFAAGDIDVLVATTIIESGLDIPNVNTLIVNDADRLGLGQLYQLRGRVGRSSNRAYACLLYGRGKRLTHQAHRRLQTIFEATELGAGFRIAMRDLEIRGAGNLLGAEQSGHIGAVGFDLYCRMLREEVENLKSEGRRPVASQQPPTIDLPLKAYIPAGYIDDLDMRLSVYQRLADLVNSGQVAEMAAEMEDRFGEMPPAVKNLLYAIRVKLLAVDAGVDCIATEGGQLIIKMVAGHRLDEELSAGWPLEGVKAGTNQLRLDMRKLGKGWEKVLEQVLNGIRDSRALTTPGESG